MASVFFPERMKFVELACPRDSAYHLIRELAVQGRVQLLDNNRDDFSTPKRYMDTYMECEDAERSLGFIQQRLEKEEGILLPPPELADCQVLIQGMNLQDTLEEIREADSQIREKAQIYEDMCRQISQRRKKLHCLRFLKPLIGQDPTVNDSEFSQTEGGTLELSIINESSALVNICGLVSTGLIGQLFRSVYRVSRRNAITHTGEAVGDLIPFAVFVSSSAVCDKVRRICESFTPDTFMFSSDADELFNTEMALENEIKQMIAIDQQTKDINIDFMRQLASEFWKWRVFIAREKQIWMTMDYGDFNKADSTVIYNGWIPERFVSSLHPLCATVQQSSGSAVGVQMTICDPEEKASEDNPIPTFIEKNSFTAPFQSLNDAYGVPNYDELNGGAFYGMYPFLFGVMFGDIGHAFFYVLGAIAMLVLHELVKRKKVNLGIDASLFSFKWLVFFAAICALYCGFIYNETFGLPIYMFKSHWEKDPAKPGKWKATDNSVYPFGIDPVWFFKDNELIFMNSYKMKLSVVMGMCQMVFGMFLQLIKHIHRRDWREILVTWIPEMLYLVPFFGYLVVIIIKKWCTKFEGNPAYEPEQQKNGVNLIQMMISMILNFGQKDKNLELYDSQWGIQTVIVVVFVISIPLLLFLKPICECYRLRGTPQFNVLEIFVMNLIHVIEFCLGALSHTASYLRLWALSLAHSQLSHVIYEELFVMTLEMHNPVVFFIGFAAFCALTVAILLGMEAFSALLHAIRLMWVEFSSKFYEGMGVSFRPLALKKALKSFGIN